MSPGKLIAQAGHAYVGAFVEATRQAPTIAQEYTSEHPASPGTKVCLQGNLPVLIRAKEEAENAGLPTFLVVDSGCANFFNGQPTITALGFGPTTEDRLPKALRKLQCL